MFSKLRKSDAQFITDVEKTIAFWDRYRKFILPVFVVMLIALFALLIWLGEFILDSNNPIVGKRFPWVLAFLLGSVFGLNLHAILKYVIEAAIGGYRAERMLLKLRSELIQSKSDVET